MWSFFVASYFLFVVYADTIFFSVYILDTFFIYIKQRLAFFITYLSTNA